MQHEAAQIFAIGLAFQQAALQQFLDRARERVLGQARRGDDVLGRDALLEADGVERDEFGPGPSGSRLCPEKPTVAEAEVNEVKP